MPSSLPALFRRLPSLPIGCLALGLLFPAAGGAQAPSSSSPAPVSAETWVLWLDWVHADRLFGKRLEAVFHRRLEADSALTVQPPGMLRSLCLAYGLPAPGENPGGRNPAEPLAAVLDSLARRIYADRPQVLRVVFLAGETAPPRLVYRPFKAYLPFFGGVETRLEMRVRLRMGSRGEPLRLRKEEAVGDTLWQGRRYLGLGRPEFEALSLVERAERQEVLAEKTAGAMVRLLREGPLRNPSR